MLWIKFSVHRTGVGFPLVQAAEVGTGRGSTETHLHRQAQKNVQEDNKKSNSLLKMIIRSLIMDPEEFCSVLMPNSLDGNVFLFIFHSAVLEADIF